MCTEVNSAMGLQATATTKRKHELTFDGKDANTAYTTNCPPPLKASRWSLNNNNYVESLEEQTKIALKSKTATAAADAKTATALLNNNNSTTANNNINNNNNNNNNDGKHCSSACNRFTAGTQSTSTSPSNGKEVTKPAAHGNAKAGTTNVNSLVSTLIPQVADLAPTTPLPPISNTPVPEDSIAKLEVVAAVPCEPWVHSNEPVDCISKLQAVAVPTDPWGGISTRSTLATTLLSADELDDDDDDFEDDYEEEESSIIPTYCPLRYHTFGSANAATPTAPHHQATRIGSYSPPQGYGSRPNYYSEPFPQQNCSRTGSPQHTRNMPNGFSQWHNTNTNSQQFYGTSEVTYPSQQQQQTIRCAENGKSYLDLGCSSTPVPSLNTATPTVPSVPPFASMHVGVPVGVGGPSLDARHPLKRCCDARGTWCNTNKNCYRDIRLKIRNLSMFKLSRFRQVSEQSLYRSVLICNTLKRIDREIEVEAKEMHQVAVAHAAHHQQQQQLYHQQHLPHHLQHHPHLTQQMQQQQQPQLLQLQQQHHDYAPVMNCARLANLDYQAHSALQQNGHPPVHYHQQQQQHQQQHYHSLPERLDAPPPPPSQQTQTSPQQQHVYLNTTSTLVQKPATSNFPLVQSNSCQNTANPQGAQASGAAATTTMPLHPYDHYPFRESQSGRATPFPNCQPVIPASSTSNNLCVQPTQTQQPAAATTITTTPAVPSNDSTTIIANAGAAPATATDSAVNTTATPATEAHCSASSSCDSDSGYADDDSTRTINWSSVLSLSSQSALDPLNSNDLFSILPPATSVTNPATAVPVPVPASISNATSTTLTTIENASTTVASIAISGTFTTVQSSGASTAGAATTAASVSCSQSEENSNAPANMSSSTTATFTTLTTIPATTYSLTSSYVSSVTTSHATNSSSSPWEYGFLDMDFGLGSEFTELVPSCKLTSDDLFKNGLTPVSASRYSSVHDNELEQPAHIMVGS